MEKIKKLCKRKIVISVVTFISSIILYTPNVFALPYKDAEFLWDYLIVDDWVNVILKVLGHWLYDFLRGIMDVIENAFTQMARLNIMQAVSINNVLRNINVIIPSIIIILIVIAVFVYMFKMQNPLKIISNGIIVALALVCFSTLISLADNFKLAMLREVDNIVEKGDYMLSDKLYADNTVDVVASVINEQLMTVDIDKVRFIDRYARTKREYINEYPVVDEETGEVKYETLQDGWFGMGNVRYFRYVTDFWSVNVTLLVSIMVYILGIFKMALLMVDWFKMNVYAPIALTRGIFDYALIGNVIKSFGQNVMGVIITYASMLLFAIFVNGIIASNVHWIVSCICIYAFGIKILMGSSAVNAFFGINDSFKDVVTGALVLNRMGKGAKKGVKNTAKMASGAKNYVADKMQGSYDKEKDNYEKNFYDNLYENEDLRNAMNEDKEQFEKDQMKDDMLKKEQNAKMKEDVMQDLHGADYKTKMAKDKILQKEQEEALKDQAMKDIYGEDYKVLQERQKILQGEEKSEAKDKALQSVYGADYKVDVEKDKIIKGKEKATSHDEAMKQVYGADYKEKQMMQRAQEKAQEYSMIDSMRGSENNKLDAERTKVHETIVQMDTKEEIGSVSDEDFNKIFEKYKDE